MRRNNLPVYHTTAHIPAHKSGIRLPTGQLVVGMSRTVLAIEAVCTRGMVFGEAYLTIIVGSSAAAVLTDHVLLDAMDIAMTVAPIIPLRKNPPLAWTVTVQVALE